MRSLRFASSAAAALLGELLGLRLRLEACALLGCFVSTLARRPPPPALRRVASRRAVPRRLASAASARLSSGLLFGLQVVPPPSASLERAAAS